MFRVGHSYVACKSCLRACQIDCANDHGELTGELIHVESKMVHQQFLLVNDKVKKNSFQKSRNKWGAVLWRCDDHDDVELQRRFLALLTSVSPSSPWLRRSAWWSGLASPATYVSATLWRMIQDYVTIPASLLVKSNIICMQASLFCSDLIHTSFLYIQLVLVHSLFFSLFSRFVRFLQPIESSSYSFSYDCHGIKGLCCWCCRC